MHRNFLKIFFFILLLFGCVNTFAKDAALKVGVLVGPPIAYQSTAESRSWHGIAINLWKQIAIENGWDYTFVPMGENAEAAIDALAQHKIDVLLGPVTVTHKRLERVDFSRAFLLNKVVAVQEKKSRSHFSSLLYMIISKIFNIIFLSMAVAFFILANLLWFFQRKYMVEFQKGYFKGVIHAIWSLLMLLIGSQLIDRPRYGFERLLILIVIVLSILFSSLLSAAITSSLTLSLVPSALEQEYSVKEIQGKTFASIAGQEAAEVIQDLGGRVVFFKSSEEAITALQDQAGIDAMVGDSVVLKYKLAHFPKFERLNVMPIPIANNEYAFAFPKKSPLLEKFNYVLAKLQDYNHVTPICLEYLSADEATACAI